MALRTLECNFHLSPENISISTLTKGKMIHYSRRVFLCVLALLDRFLPLQILT